MQFYFTRLVEHIVLHFLYLEGKSSVGMSLVEGGVDDGGVNPLVATVALVVGAQDDAVVTGDLHPQPVVGEALDRVEVEHKQQLSALKGNHLVIFMLPTDIALNKKKKFMTLYFKMGIFSLN